jgi:anti-sigma-K factor RskA
MNDNFKLDDLPKHNIYQVPENYFERLPMRIMERTVSAPVTQSWQTNMFWRPVRMAIAPLVLLLVFLGVFYLNMPQDTEKGALNLASLNNQEIVDYLSTYAKLESADFAELSSIERHELTADLLNIDSKTAEAELEYYQINTIDY